MNRQDLRTRERHRVGFNEESGRRPGVRMLRCEHPSQIDERPQPEEVIMIEQRLGDITPALGEMIPSSWVKRGFLKTGGRWDNPGRSQRTDLESADDFMLWPKPEKRDILGAVPPIGCRLHFQLSPAQTWLMDNTTVRVKQEASGFLMRESMRSIPGVDDIF
ncbi:hypothetical protein Bbelb_204720 [Branchiostoma belcheri]|nr:hypothetical protein Bbelb_204720 [Branchiostoma belcheri]